jgi:hypothetical protein
MRQKPFLRGLSSNHLHFHGNTYTLLLLFGRKKIQPFKTDHSAAPVLD